MGDNYSELIAYRDSLKQQIQATDLEIDKCKQTMKGWKAATIIGSIGTAATGIAAVAQNQTIKENKQELKESSADAKEAEVAIEILQEVKQ